MKVPEQAKQPTLTDEQQQIIAAKGHLTINAVAGSGKTTTIIEYAAQLPATTRILYLAFNKTVKLEAARRFTARGLHNVKVETAHSLAYRHILHNSQYTIRAQGYKVHEIAALLELKGDGQKHTEFIIANHINKFFLYFCNSDKPKVQDLNYLNTIHDAKAKTFVRSFYKLIENGTRQLLAKMDKAAIGITHDFYLKKFQLSKPALPYDYILFDEGQDASAVMLDVFLIQPATKVIVGDTHQQIYGWRYAVNSLDKTGYTTYQLSTSFRFHQDIAELAKEVLNLKTYLGDHTPVQLTGNGKTISTKIKATIARTNLGLLLHAINYVADNRKVKHIYFEGNLHSYTYADDGASLYDVLNLYSDKHHLIRDPLIKSMNSLDDLEEYIDKTGDVQLSMMIEIVKEYGNEIPGIIHRLKELHTGDDDRDKATMIFSTVHRAKGMEYDEVTLVDDFIKKTTLEKVKSAKKDEQPDLAKLNEEINLLYVAITRTKNNLYIPAALIPENVTASPHIHIIKPKAEESNYTTLSHVREPVNYRKGTKGTRYERPAKTTAVRSVRKGGNNAWTKEDDDLLLQWHYKDASIVEMADYFGRTKGAIMSRLRKLSTDS